MLAMYMRGALIVGSVATLLVGSLGIASAQSTTDAAHKRAVIDDAAAKLGISGDQLADALKQARKDVGVNQGQPRAKELVRDELTVAAKTIGLADLKALRAELRGSTLTAVAQKHTVAPATVAAAMKTDVDAKIDALVAQGKLKADRAAKLKTKAATKIDNLMTREFKAKSA